MNGEAMELNIDFSLPSRLKLKAILWETSLEPSMSYRVLDRIGVELTQATRPPRKLGSILAKKRGHLSTKL